MIKCAITHSNRIKQKGFELFFFGNNQFDNLYSKDDYEKKENLDLFIIYQNGNPTNTLNYAKKISTHLPSAKIIVDIPELNPSIMDEFLEYPIRGLVCFEQNSPSELRSILYKVYSNGFDFSMIHHSFPFLAPRIDSYVKSIPQLKTMDLSILYTFCETRSISKTAAILKLHRNSISNHINNIMETYQLNDKIDLIMKARDLGWVAQNNLK